MYTAFRYAFFFLLFSLGVLKAQGKTQHIIDSLHKALATAGTDTMKARVMMDLGSNYCMLAKFDSGYSFYDRAFRLCKKNESVMISGKQEADSWSRIYVSIYNSFTFYYARQHSNNNSADSIYRILETRWTQLGAGSAVADLKESYSNVLFDRSMTDKGIRILRESMAYWEGVGNKTKLAELESKLGRAYQKKNDYPAALDHFFKSLALAEAIKNEKLMAQVYGQLGNVYRSIENYETALEYYLKALPIRERGDDPTAVVGMLMNIGITYMQTGDNDKALQYHWKAYKQCKKINDWVHQSMELNNIAIIYLDKKRYDTAIVQLKEAVAIRRMHNDKDGIAWYMNAVGDAFNMWKKPDSAIHYFNASMYAIDGITIPEYTFRSVVGLASAHQMKKNYSSALEYAGKARAIADHSGALEQSMMIEELYSMIYHDKGDYRQAFEHYTQFIRMRDSISNDDKSKQIGKLEAKSEFDKQKAIADAEYKKELEKQQALADADTKRKNVIIISVVIGMLIVALFAIFIFNRLRITRRQKLIIENQKAEVELQKAIIEDKNKEIIDSINYAKRIQQSLLPTEKYIDKSLKKMQN